MRNEELMHYDLRFTKRVKILHVGAEKNTSGKIKKRK